MDKPHFKKTIRIKEQTRADGSATRTIFVTEEPLVAVDKAPPPLVWRAVRLFLPSLLIAIVKTVRDHLLRGEE